MKRRGPSRPKFRTAETGQSPQEQAFRTFRREQKRLQLELTNAEAALEVWTEAGRNGTTMLRFARECNFLQRRLRLINQLTEAAEGEYTDLLIRQQQEAERQARRALERGRYERGEPTDDDFT